MSSLKKRLEAIEVKTGKGEEVITLEFGDLGPVQMTRNQLGQLIMAVQGSCLRPVTDEEIRAMEAEGLHEGV